VNMRVHLGLEYRTTGLIRCACGHHVVEKDGLHAWVDGKSRFWAMEVEDVNCKRCLRARENYLQRRVAQRFS